MAEFRKDEMGRLRKASGYCRGRIRMGPLIVGHLTKRAADVSRACDQPHIGPAQQFTSLLVDLAAGFEQPVWRFHVLFQGGGLLLVLTAEFCSDATLVQRRFTIAKDADGPGHEDPHDAGTFYGVRLAAVQDALQFAAPVRADACQSLLVLFEEFILYLVLDGLISFAEAVKADERLKLNGAGK